MHEDVEKHFAELKRLTKRYGEDHPKTKECEDKFSIAVDNVRYVGHSAY